MKRRLLLVIPAIAVLLGLAAMVPFVWPASPMKLSLAAEIKDTVKAVWKPQVLACNEKRAIVAAKNKSSWRYFIFDLTSGKSVWSMEIPDNSCLLGRDCFGAYISDVGRIYIYRDLLNCPLPPEPETRYLQPGAEPLYPFRAHYFTDKWWVLFTSDSIYLYEREGLDCVVLPRKYGEKDFIYVSDKAAVLTDMGSYGQVDGILAGNYLPVDYRFEDYFTANLVIRDQRALVTSNPRRLTWQSCEVPQKYRVFEACAVQMDSDAIYLSFVSETDVPVTLGGLVYEVDESGVTSVSERDSYPIIVWAEDGTHQVNVRMSGSVHSGGTLKHYFDVRDRQGRPSASIMTSRTERSRYDELVFDKGSVFWLAAKPGGWYYQFWKMAPIELSDGPGTSGDCYTVPGWLIVDSIPLVAEGYNPDYETVYKLHLRFYRLPTDAIPGLVIRPRLLWLAM